MKNIFYIFIFTITLTSFSVYSAEDDFLEDAASPNAEQEVNLPVYEASPSQIQPIIKKVSSNNSQNADEANKTINPNMIGLEAESKVTIKNEYIPFDGANSETLNNQFDSLFFTREQIDYLYSKIKILKTSGKNLDAVVNSIKDASQQVSSISNNASENVQPSAIERIFSLDSILFPSDGNWTVWINDSKIRRAEAEKISDFVIKDVGENFVNIYFFANDLNLDSPNYRNILNLQENTQTNVKITEQGASYKALDRTKILTSKQIKEADYNWDYKSSDNRIWIASADNLVKITLKLRQEFKLSQMKIFEGNSSPKNSVEELTTDAESSDEASQGENAANALDVLDPNNTAPVSAPQAEKPATLEN
jgi:hypothetical protein